MSTSNFFLASESSQVEIAVVETTTQAVESTSSIGCEGCTGCDSNQDGFKLPFKEFPFLIVALVLVVLLLVKKNKLKVLFWILGVTLFVGLAFSLAQNGQSDPLTSVDCPRDTVWVGSNDDVSIESTTIDSTAEDEFFPISNDDEFEAFDENNDVQLSSEEVAADTDSWFTEAESTNLFRTLLALGAALVAGFLFRYSWGRNFRTFFLLASLVYFGFYGSGCPCMISSFQNLILLLLGESTSWISLVWIVGLLLVTYFFGKIWCGWICHLGAVQEFLYLPGKTKVMMKPSIQNAFKIIRLTALWALLVQLVITRTNLFIKIDPFKVIFNLYSSNTIGYVLLSILLISSLFIYRPFCRGFCPVGLILGWIEMIPGASKLQIQSECRNCNQCSKKCHYQAVSVSQQGTMIDNSECIRCGDCVDVCRFHAIKRK